MCQESANKITKLQTANKPLHSLNPNSEFTLPSLSIDGSGRKKQRSTSQGKMCENAGALAHFDLQMRLAPQRRAISGHRNAQKWPEPGSF